MADHPTCHGCHRPNKGVGNVCEPCRNRAADQLAELARLGEQLPLALVPGGTGGGDGVKHQKSDSAPMPLRLDAFNLLAAGCVDFDLRETAHQVGTLPLQVWLDAWHADWEPRYGLAPARVQIDMSHEAKDANAALMRSLLTGSKLVIGYYYGPGDGHPILAPISDTLDAEHAARYGRPDSHGINDTIAALASRLDAACDDHEDIGNFLVGLRAMVGACRSVVGERGVETFLGRCPIDRKLPDGGTELCGGALWQDPYVSEITCPRCKTGWQEKHWLLLGGMIRKAWPPVEDVHRFAAELVTVHGAKPGTTEPVEVDRWWAASCSCGQWLDDGQPVKVRGRNKIDVRGLWRLHVDEAMAPMSAQVEDMAEAS